MALSIPEIHTMLDLRSDTASLPTDSMREAMKNAALGDGGRMDLTGRGEDPTVFALENLAATMTGMDDAIFLPTGSLGNHAAMYTAADRGDMVLVEETAHIYINEQSDFIPRFGGLVPVLYRLTKEYQVDPEEIERLLSSNDIKVMCLENSHNYSGGTCQTPENTRIVCALAHARGVHVHMDGARIFNAAVSLGTDVKAIAAHVDSMMFCISKGLCAPVGSLLVGKGDFIAKARATCKLMGMFMRQSGVIAAAGIVALNENISRLKEDHANAALLGRLLSSIGNARMNPTADQTNFVYMNVSPTGLTAQQVVDGLRARGLLVAEMTGDSIRLALCRNISRVDVEKAAAIVVEYFNSLR